MGVGGLSDTGEDEGEEEAEDRSAAGLPVPASFSCGGGGDGAASTCCLLPGVGVGDSVTRAVTRKVRNVLGTLSDRERCFSRAVAGCWGGAGAGAGRNGAEKLWRSVGAGDTYPPQPPSSAHVSWHRTKLDSYPALYLDRGRSQFP